MLMSIMASQLCCLSWYIKVIRVKQGSPTLISAEKEIGSEKQWSETIKWLAMKLLCFGIGRYHYAAYP